MNHVSSIRLLIFPLLFAVSVSAQGAPPDTLVHRDDFPVLHNSAPRLQETAPLRIVPVRRFTRSSVKDAAQAFVNPYDVAVQYNTVYILENGMLTGRHGIIDMTTPTIVVCDTSGTPRIVLPLGVLYAPEKLFIAENGDFHVYDSQYGMTVFGPDGEKTREYGSRNDSYSFYANDTCFLCSGGHAKSFEDLPERPLLSIFNSRDGYRRSIGAPRNYYEKNKLSYTAVVDSDGSVFVAYKNYNRFEKYDTNGGLQLRFDRELDFSESTDQHSVLIDTSQGAKVSVIVRNQFTRAVCLDDRDRLFVQTYMREISDDEHKNGISDEGLYSVEIYSTEGILLYRLLWPYGNRQTLVCVHGDRLFFRDPVTRSISEYALRPGH